MNRSKALEERLKEEMGSVPLQRVPKLENDVRMLIELVRRVQEDGVWRIDGLNFQELNLRDIFGEIR